MSSAERLYLRDFGPVSEADLEVRDLTVLVGPQASGKSLAAQLLCLLRGLDDYFIETAPEEDEIAASLFDDPHDAGVEEDDAARAPDALLATLRWWFGTRLPGLLYPGKTRVAFTGAGTGPADAATTLSLDAARDDALVLNDPLRAKIDALLEGFPAPRARPDRARGQFYIPAGRVMYSYFPPARAMAYRRRGLRLPGHIETFYEDLETAISLLHEASTRTGRQVELFPEENSPLPEYVRQRLRSLLKGNLFFDKRNVRFYPRLRNRNKPALLPVWALASGQMETWPLCVSIEAALLRRTPSQVYLEEPEAHLHPAAQRSLMEAVAWLVEQRLMRFVITTHSPYVIDALNNFLTAHKVREARRPPPLDLLDMPALPPSQVSVYSFADDAPAKPLLNDDTGIIDTSDIDAVAAALRGDLARLRALLDDGGA